MYGKFVQRVSAYRRPSSGLRKSFVCFHPSHFEFGTTGMTRPCHIRVFLQVIWRLPSILFYFLHYSSRLLSFSPFGILSDFLCISQPAHSNPSLSKRRISELLYWEIYTQTLIGKIWRLVPHSVLSCWGVCSPTSGWMITPFQTKLGESTSLQFCQLIYIFIATGIQSRMFPFKP